MDKMLLDFTPSKHWLTSTTSVTPGDEIYLCEGLVSTDFKGTQMRHSLSHLRMPESLGVCAAGTHTGPLSL